MFEPGASAVGLHSRGTGSRDRTDDLLFVRQALLPAELSPRAGCGGRNRTCVTTAYETASGDQHPLRKMAPTERFELPSSRFVAGCPSNRASRAFLLGAPGKSRTCSRRLRTPVPIQLGVGGNGVAGGNRSVRRESARSSEAPSPCRHGVAGGNRTLVCRCCRPVPGHSDPPQAGRWVRERFRSHGVVPWCPRTHEPGAPGGI